MAELKPRCDIDERYKWKIEDIFADEKGWESAVAETRQLSGEVLKCRGHVCDCADKLFAVLKLLDELGEKLLSVVAYACMRRDEDNDVSKNRAMADKAAILESEVADACSFFEPEVIKVGKATVEKFLDELEPLRQYEQFFDNLFREAKYILDEKGERLLAISSPMGDVAHDIFSAMNNADIKFGKVRDEKGEDVELTHSRYGFLMESGDRNVRRSAYEAMYCQYEKYKNAFAAMYAGSVKSDLFYAKARGFDSTLTMRLSDSNISEDIYNRLIDDVNGGLSELSEYLSLRKSALGVDELHMYDLYAPIVAEDKEKISYEDACEMVIAACRPLGEKYVNDMRCAFSERWVDVYENRGKTSGAYSWGDNTNHPFVLMNYQETTEDVFTLAHEMGHAMHSYYTNKTQPPVYRDYKIFVAEVASTVNENLLLEYLLKDAKGGRRAYLLGRKLEAIRTTFYRQTMFAEFEKAAHEQYMNGTPLTAEKLCSLYGDINKKYYGDVAVCDAVISYEWARIPHFYTSFYVYQYATGFAAATRIKELVCKDVSAAEKYMEFLGSGSSGYPLALLKKAGADLGDSDTAKSVVRDMHSAVCELKILLDKQ